MVSKWHSQTTCCFVQCKSQTGWSMYKCTEAGINCRVTYFLTIVNEFYFLTSKLCTVQNYPELPFCLRYYRAHFFKTTCAQALNNFLELWSLQVNLSLHSGLQCGETSIVVVFIWKICIIYLLCLHQYFNTVWNETKLENGIHPTIIMHFWTIYNMVNF